MSWFSRKPTQEKYVEAAITVATNLYLCTTPGADKAPAPLHFSRSDSRYRYLIFCISTVVTAALAYDEKKLIKPIELINGCLLFANFVANDRPQDFFDNTSDPLKTPDLANLLLKEFAKAWAEWPKLEKQGMSPEVWNLISEMIHSVESEATITQTDRTRLGPLALEIDCRLPAMRSALVELAKR